MVCFGNADSGIILGMQMKKDEHKENAIALFYNGSVWYDHKTFTKYSQGDAVS